MRAAARAGVGLLILSSILMLEPGCARSMANANRRTPPPMAVTTTMRRQILNAADAGDGDAVANQLRRQMAEDPSTVSLRLQLAAHYRKMGLPELEMEHLRVAVERFPESAEARLALAETLRAVGLPARCAETLQGFARPDAAVLNKSGVCHDEAGDWKSGEQAFRQALALAPGLDYLHNNLGYNLMEQGRLAEATTAFEGALKRNPDSMVARNNLGAALARASLQNGGSVDEALQHFQNVVDSATAYNNLAATLIEQGRYDESRRLLEAALDYNRSHAAALANLKLLSELDGKPVEWRVRPQTRSRHWPVTFLRWVFGAEPQPAASGSPKKGEM
ncbi:MAG: tetratricopeptide repeat protein [Acidobacteria bacterium]|nr:tetratricopeptide repeat protein [Acidobacteriota bacterium]